VENRLAKEVSPYLQQHKKNPVDWWPYSKEAFDAAKKADKPVFISIGYSTCHWCHVMARESFSDQETADFMNSNFVNIKMDREEYPGVDKAYQEMFQLLNRRGGGWPLSVWTHPDGSAFFIGTYFPKKANFGLHSFMDVNKRIVEAWQNERDTLDSQATSLTRGLRSMGAYMYQQSKHVTEEDYKKEILELQRKMDHRDGGIGSAPKFPRFSVLRFLLHEGFLKEKQELIDFVRFTFTKMMRGGIYDQLGGGMSRYSVDSKWLVPHFEKMLYDNAGLIQLGAELFAITKDPYIEFTVKDTINWIAREMKSPIGGFFAAMNAESKDDRNVEREGAYFVWTQKELQKLLGHDFKYAQHRYGITEKGNFKDPHHPDAKGMNVLSIVKNMQEIASELDISEELVFQKLGSIRQTLFEERLKRSPPSTDTKIITSWNAMLIKSLFIAAEYLNYPEASKFAKGALDFIFENLVEQNTVLRRFHILSDGQEERKIDGVLDDYSLLISALIQAYEYTDNWDHLIKAKRIQDLTDAKFYDETEGVYFLNPITEDSFVSRVIQASDDSMASGLAATVDNLFKLGKYFEDNDLLNRGQRVAQKFGGRVNEYPGAMSALLISMSYYLRYPTEIVIVQDNENHLGNAHFGNFLPRRLVYKWNDKNNKDARPKWEVLEGRTEVETPTVYICKGMTCSLPLIKADSVQQELSKINASLPENE
jgi:uncharacterized protein YyaL (SSP411 family)